MCEKERQRSLRETEFVRDRVRVEQSVKKDFARDNVFVGDKGRRLF